MDLEFLLRRKPIWKDIMQGTPFKKGSITKSAEAAEEEAGDP